MVRTECFGEEVLQQIGVKDPTKKILTLLLARSRPNLLYLYDTSSFDISFGQHTHQVDLFVAPSKDWMVVGNVYLEGSSWTRSTVSSPYVRKISR